MACLAVWFLLSGLPISFFQLAEVGLHTPWTIIVDGWVTPLDEVAKHTVIAITLLAIIRHRLRSRMPKPNKEPVTLSPSVQNSACESRAGIRGFRILKPIHSKTPGAHNNFLKISAGVPE
jgi:hypothetical protein